MCEYMRMFGYMQHSFRIRDFENAIICGKIYDMRILAKYAIAYSNITSIPIGGD